MKPTLKPGDLLVVKGSYSGTPKIGEMITFKSKRLDKLVVHRVVDVKYYEGKPCVYTKGDNLTDVDENFLLANEVIGLVKWRIPKIAFFFYIIKKTAPI